MRCVAAGTKLERIVAVTFTHAAAGEMKLRLREELGKAGQSAADLELAFVGTIHSFCARLLRERPVEAGLDPRFVELDEQQAAALFAVVFRRWVERRLSQPSPTLRRAITRLTWRDDGEGRDPLASLRTAAWSLVQWRDHAAPWKRHAVERVAALDSIVAGAGEIATMRRECRSGDSPVSYTHLDVYKRQVRARRHAWPGRYEGRGAQARPSSRVGPSKSAASARGHRRRLGQTQPERPLAIAAAA